MTQTAPVIASDCKRRLSGSLQSIESIRQETVDKPRSVRSFIHPVFFYFELHGKVFTKGLTGHWTLEGHGYVAEKYVSEEILDVPPGCVA